ncbi:MAG: nucleoside-diphosphate-sugar epimerase [Cytophagaceae bacterium SCN 52-12]|nr:MAG: nucleoside-diphosphate-sugar epimerase [Cytophagaceae bacterium SCN 52-12]
MKKILITGGAGFIGSHLCDELIQNGYEPIVYDNLDLQVHGCREAAPEYLPREATFIHGDVRDEYSLARAVAMADAVVHFAAKVGVGQSMYQIEHYTDVNNRGTALLLDILSKTSPKKLLVASSMSIYGEGYYELSGRKIEVPLRPHDQLQEGRWNIRREGTTLYPVPTDEEKTPMLASVYALSKYDQERICLMVGDAYNFPVVALRFFNVYGERQSLSNPYTGVLAIFAARLLSGKAPVVFEDGLQKRDFVNVRDVAVACRLALESDDANGQAINIGSGKSYSILEVARHLSRVLGKEDIAPLVTGKYRTGDIRNCFADISKARALLGYEPAVGFEEGLTVLAAWLATQQVSDQGEKATLELLERGLTV